MDATVKANRGSVKVWSPYIRIFHWSLVLAVGVAWLGSESARNIHEFAGYCAAGLIAWRLLAGLAGSGYTRFAQFIRPPDVVAGYVVDIAAHREKRYLGHNPAGGAMVLALIGSVAGTALTGWMQTTDMFWGVAWVEDVHEFLGNAIVVLVALHVAGVVLASVRHRENLVRAMVTGLKRAPGPNDVA